MGFNNRELDVMEILATHKALTSTQIVNSGYEKGLTQSTVQSVLRKMMAREFVEAVGIVHSGNVLSRTFDITEKGKKALLDDFKEHYRKISGIVSLDEVVKTLKEE